MLNKFAIAVGVETLCRFDLLSVPFFMDMTFGTLDCLFFNLKIDQNRFGFVWKVVFRELKNFDLLSRISFFTLAHNCLNLLFRLSEGDDFNFFRTASFFLILYMMFPFIQGGKFRALILL